MAYLPVAIAFDGTDWLSAAGASRLANSTDFTARWAFKRNGNPAADETFYRFPSTRFRIQLTTGGQLQLICNDTTNTLCLSAVSTGASLADNAWHHVVMTRTGYAAPVCMVDGVARSLNTTTNVSVGLPLIHFAQAGAYGLLANSTGTLPLIGDVSDMWFKAGASFALAAGATGFNTAAGELKDLGASGVAEGMTPDIWHRNPLATWHVNSGALGDFWALNGTLAAAPDAPPGEPTAGGAGMAFPPPTRRLQHMLVR